MMINTFITGGFIKEKTLMVLVSLEFIVDP